MKEIEKAKKEAAKFKAKRDKEKAKEKKAEGNEQGAETDDTTPDLLKRNSTPYLYKPRPPYALHSTPSVTQLVYQPPSLERFNSVRKSSKAVTSLALSLEPSRPTSNHGVPIPPSSPPQGGLHGTYSTFAPFMHQSPPEIQADSSITPVSASTHLPVKSIKIDKTDTTRPTQPGKRVFSDPGPGPSSTTFSKCLNPDNLPRERSRSPYGFSRTPQAEAPTVERKRPSSQSSSFNTSSASPVQPGIRKFSTPAQGSSNMGCVPEEKEPTPTAPRSAAAWTGSETRQSSFTYFPPPPPPPVYTETPPPPDSAPSTATRPQEASPLPRKPSISPPPPPRHGTTYIVLKPYLSHEIGHLSLIPFDMLVDAAAHIPEESNLPYPTALDPQPKHYWQASLGNQRGHRGLFPSNIVCSIDDEKVTLKLSESWFAEEGVGFIADAQGRCWVGPRWKWKEPVRRRSKWWAEEF